MSAVTGADSDDDNEMFDEFSCGDLYSFGQTQQQTQSNEKPEGNVPTTAAAPSPPPPGPAASSVVPPPSGKEGPAPVSRPLDAPSSIDKPSPSAPRQVNQGHPIFSRPHVDTQLQSLQLKPGLSAFQFCCCHGRCSWVADSSSADDRVMFFI